MFRAIEVRLYLSVLTGDSRLSLDEAYALVEKQWTPYDDRKECFLHDLRRCRRGSGPMTYEELRQILQVLPLTYLCLVDSSVRVNWTSPFVK